MPETPCEGAWLEFGVFIGVTINQTAKYQQRACKQGGTLPVYGFDTFTGAPLPMHVHGAGIECIHLYGAGTRQ